MYVAKYFFDFCVHFTDCVSVTLTSSGPLTNESTIALCSNEIRHVIFMECVVRESDRFLWRFEPLHDVVVYNTQSQVGLKIIRSPITLSLINSFGACADYPRRNVIAEYVTSK